MTIAAKLPKSTLDIRGDRLRFQLANAINECEQQYRLGKTDKATNTIALLNAAITILNGLTSVGSVTISNVSTDNSITAAEAASNIPVTGTTVNCNGKTATLFIDGVSMGNATVASNAYSITLTSAAATALSIGSHTFRVDVVDAAGILRTASRSVARTA